MEQSQHYNLAHEDEERWTSEGGYDGADPENTPIDQHGDNDSEYPSEDTSPQQ